MARPPPCVATPYKDSTGGRNLYRSRPGSISVRTAVSIESRVSRPACLGSHLNEAGLELVGGDVGAVLRYDAARLIRRHGDPGVSTRRQQATSRSSSEYKRNWSGAVAPTTW